MKEYTDKDLLSLMQSLGKHDPQDYQLCENADCLIFEAKDQPYYYFVQHQDKWLLLVQKNTNVYCFDPEGNWKANDFQLLPQPEYTIRFCRSWFIYGANNENELGYTGAIAFALYHTLSQYDIDTCCENTTHKKIRRGNRIAFDLKRQALMGSVLNGLYVPSAERVAELSDARERALEQLISQQQPRLEARAPSLLQSIKAEPFDQPSLHAITPFATMTTSPPKKESNEKEAFSSAWLPKTRGKRRVESDSESDDEQENQKATLVKRSKLQPPATLETRCLDSQLPTDEMQSAGDLLEAKIANAFKTLFNKSVRVNIYNTENGRGYCWISGLPAEEMKSITLALSEKFKQLNSLSLFNTATFNAKKKYMGLSREQVHALLEGALPPTAITVQHYLFFQPRTIQTPFGDYTLWCQVLDQKGIDQDKMAKDIAGNLNEVANKNKKRSEQRYDLFVGVDVTAPTSLRFIWTRDATAYQTWYREERMVALKKRFPDFELPSPEKTPYDGLNQNATIHWRMFLQHLAISTLDFQLSHTGSYHSQPLCNQVTYYRDKMCQLAKGLEELMIDTVNDVLILDSTHYQRWLNVLRTKFEEHLGHGKRRLTERNFFLYPTDLGDRYYIHFIEPGRHPYDLLEWFNKETRATGKPDCFKVDYALVPPVIYAKEDDYTSWMKSQGAEANGALSEQQQSFLQKLQQMHYHPEMQYELSILQSCLKQLTSVKEVDVLKTYQVKTAILDAHRQQEKPERKIGRDLQMALNEPLETTLKQCSILSDQLAALYSCDAAGVYQLLKQFIYPMNNKATHLIFQDGKISLKITDDYEPAFFPEENLMLPSKNQSNTTKSAKIIATQVVCAAIDALAHAHYCNLFTRDSSLTALLFAPQLDQALTHTIRRTRAHAHEISDPLSDATTLLRLNRLDIITASLSFHGHTLVAISGIENAGQGLYIKGPITLKPGDIITWFSGNIIDAKDVPIAEQHNVIALEPKISQAARVIIPTPDVKNGVELGQGMRANHSPKANAEFQNVYGETGVVGKILVYKGPKITLDAGKALELFANYGKNAQKQHGIKPDKDFTAAELELSTRLISIATLKPLTPLADATSSLTEARVYPC